MLNKFVKNKSWMTVVAVMLIGFAAFMGFRPLFEVFTGGVIKEFISAIFGTLFTVLLTMFMLNKQTEVEEEKSRSESVFNERIALYKEIIQHLEKVISDGVISMSEINQIQFLLLRINMVAGDNVIEALTHFYDDMVEIFARESTEEEVNQLKELEFAEYDTLVTSDEKVTLLTSISKFSALCRVELGLSLSQPSKEVFESAFKSISRTQEVVENKINPTSWSADENDTVLVLAGANAEQVALDNHIYVCQNKRNFRPCGYIAFYNRGKISHLFKFKEPPIDDIGILTNTSIQEVVKYREKNQNNPEFIKQYVEEGYLNRVIRLTPFDGCPEIINDLVSEKSGKTVPFTYGSPRYVQLNKFLAAKKTSDLR